MKKINRNSPIIILKDSIKAIKNIVILGIITILATDMKVKTIITGHILFLVIWQIYIYLSWKNKVFYIRNNELIFKRGVFLKKLTNIDIDKITTVDIEQDFIQRLFKLTLVKINTETVSVNSEIRLTIKLEEANMFRNELIGAIKEEINEENTYRINKKELLLYSLSKSNIMFMAGTVFSIIVFLDEFINYNEVMEKLPGKWIILIVLVALIVIKILSIIISYSKYYKFKMEYKEEAFIITYGYITKKKYSIVKKNISGVKIKQNFYQKLLKKATVSISAIGYGNEEAEEAILFPLIEIKNIDKIINDILPSFNYCGDMKKPHPKARLSYFYKPLICLGSVVILIGIVKFKLAVLAIIVVLPILIYRCKVKFDNSSFGYNDEIVCIKTGGLGTKTSLIDINYIDSIKFSETFFQRKHKIGTLRIRYKAASIFDLREIKGIREIDRMNF